jgi:hypothetical protein
MIRPRKAKKTKKKQQNSLFPVTRMTLNLSTDPKDFSYLRRVGYTHLHSDFGQFASEDVNNTYHCSIQAPK